jgi:carboxynorspermidine decarboxylase
VPSFVISLSALDRNARVLRGVADAAGCRVVLALKGFACWKAFPALSPHLDGCCASGLWEARLARDHFGAGKHVLTHSPAFRDGEVAELCEFTHHLDFNSPEQWQRFREQVTSHPRFRSGDLHCGLRINPECSTGRTALYDPCAPGSRLGTTAAQLAGPDLDGITGLHFHTLCEQGADDLATTLDAVDERFGDLLRSPRIRYLNIGGGHWITKPAYDRERLVGLIREAREKYDVEIWLEPGEAAAIHTGVLRASVLDVFESAGHRHAILDVSATAHMPDVLEMPYRPEVFLAERNSKLQTPNSKPAVTLECESYHPATNPGDSAFRAPHSAFVHRLAGPTCLAGDVIGDYAFPRPLQTGDTLVFDDMAHYTMVKTTTFNGVPHPDIGLQYPDGRLETIREFGYTEFRDRLA